MNFHQRANDRYVAGIVRDISGSYLGSMCVCAACLMVSVALGFLMPADLAFKQPHNHHQHHTHVNNHHPHHHREEMLQVQGTKPEKETSLLVHSTNLQKKYVTYSASHISLQD